MAKFCTKCGEPLTENHVCKVKDEIKEESSVIDDIVDIYKNAVTKPITIIKEYINKIDMKVIAIITILGMIISGLSYYCVTTNSLKGAVSDATSKITGAALMQEMDTEKDDDYFGSSSKETIDDDTMDEMINAKDNIQVPFTNMFILGVVGLLSLLGAFTLSAKIFIGLCFKAKASMMEFLKLHTLALPLHSILILISTLLSYVSYKISGPILILSLVTYIITVVEGYIEVIKANKNKLMYSVALTTTVALVVSVVVVGITASAMLANFYAQQTALY